MKTETAVSQLMYDLATDFKPDRLTGGQITIRITHVLERDSGFRPDSS